MKIVDSLPTTHYELTISFDYTGEIGEYDNTNRGDAWKELLNDEQAVIDMLVSSGLIDEQRLLDIDIALCFVGEEQQQRKIASDYANEDNQYIGKI